MTAEEYINEHPEKFADDIDKWLYTEFYIVGGCCSAQGSMEYSVARMVAEKMKQQMIEKTCEWLNNFYNEDRRCFLVKEDIDAYKQAMEE